MAIEITLNTNFPQVLLDIRQKVVTDIVNNNHPILLTAAGGVLALVAYRIHTEGKRANGSDIGTYTPAYMKVRERPPYNRTGSVDMVFSLTRQMENDFTVIDEGPTVGLGFKNSHNADKARWLEAYKPGTYTLSDSEEEVVVQVINDYINGIFS